MEITKEDLINKEYLLNKILELPVKKKSFLKDRVIDLINFPKLRIRIQPHRIIYFYTNGDIPSSKIFELNDGDFDNVINHFYITE